MNIEYIIFAGVNGAGKSTFYNHIEGFPNKRINSDEILREMNGDWKNRMDQINAMREAVRRINEYIQNGISFNQETTLTGNSIIKNIKKAKDKGYIIKVYYIGLESADLAIQRVRTRVQKGGHGIEENDIRRRYKQSLENFVEILPICDKVEVYDNTDRFACVALFENGQMKFKRKCKWLEACLQDEMV